MSGFEVLLFGVLIGLLVMVIVRPQTLVIPMLMAQPTTGGGAGCLLPLILGLLLLALLFGGRPL